MSEREYRPFGKTGLLVSGAGLGTEYLNGQSLETVVATVAKAAELGVNYMDVLFSFPAYRDNLAKAIAGQRDKWVLAVHLGCAETDGQYRNTRDVVEVRATFEDFLYRFETDHADVLFIQMVDSQEDLEKVLAPGGLYELAQEYVKAGRAKAIGISGHISSVLLKALQTGKFDAVMFPFSPGGRGAEVQLLPYCREKGIAFVAMKPFCGGRLVAKNSSGERLMAPAECIGYVLSTPGVTTCVPGAANVEHIMENASRIPGHDLPGFSEPAVIAAKVKELGAGECLYCGHCLPCPNKVDIPRIIEIVDEAQWGEPAKFAESYGKIEGKAEMCAACGNCVQRCPYGVNIIKKMSMAREFFK